MDKYFDLVNYEGLYSITETAIIKSHDRLVKSRWKEPFLRKGRIMKQKINSDGYMSIMLSDENCKQKTFLVHRLVALNFIENPDNLPQVNHKNNIKTDNRVTNLKWGTCLSNSREAALDGLYKAPKGSKKPEAKLNEAQILFMKNIYNEGFVLQKELAKMFGVCKQVINNIVNQKTWKHV